MNMMGERMKRAESLSYILMNDMMKHEEKIGRKLTREEVFDFFFERTQPYGTKYDIRVLTPKQEDLIHRLNMLWAVPLTILVIPINYVINGQIAWDDTTAIGRFILRSVGLDN